MPVLDDVAPFPGLLPEALDFLRQLKQNNDREWFRPRKAVYDDELLEPMRMLVADLSRRLPARGLPLTGDPRRAVFRIYRDTRFSNDKSPYKTHVAAALTRGADRRAPGALYVHVEPGATRVGGGFWRADKTFHRRWREQMAADPEPFLRVVEEVEAAGLTLSSAGAALTRMPRGFEDARESPAADYFRWRGGFAAMRDDVPDDAVLTPAFTDLVVETADALRPLLEYGWALVDAAP